jgi:diaminohydroxyphosphoribosylaminopyrimidine deaminase/5-amino-6-(5-phosphoribosylamino)uracil reductase
MTSSSTSGAAEQLAVDGAHMDRALELAARGCALASPNPMVGAVLVRGGAVVGEGFHTYEGLRHAEIVALEAAGKAAHGATAYVTLEPCRHTGRTGPCTQALIAAGVTRVVAAMSDPNPAVAGGGFQQLRAAGIEVTAGVREAEAQRLNEAFARWIVSRKPFVTLKSALTLDGRIAAHEGEPIPITGAESLQEGQRLRHQADAILTGIGTVLADNPRMTDRSGGPRRRKLMRVVVDSRLRIPLGSALVKSADNDVTVFTLQPETSPRFRALLRAGVEVVRGRPAKRRVDLRSMLRELGRRQILSVQVEAGAALNGALLESRLVDKVVLFYSPRIMGTPGVPVATMSAKWFVRAPILTNIELQKYGRDFVVEGYLRDVYRTR